MEKKTHSVVKDPTIPVQYLADYMSASTQARRTIVQKSKYKSLARTFQHQIARRTISDHLLEGNPLPGDLSSKADDVRHMLADEDFQEQLYGYNADFIEAFSAVSTMFDLSGFDLMAPQNIGSPEYNGTKVKFTPSLLTYRKTKVNTQKVGAIMYRYAKGSPLSVDVGQWQSAFMFGYLAEAPFIEESKPEQKLCMVLCAVAGATITAPTNSIYRFNEMKAACSDIAEKWANVPPPNGAVL
ncbi:MULTISPECIES: hypothetical protein [unclassified Shinella]|uniref:hypothetical protein n=1 Tax=unclassified Shinella TaxID=2643062 RepID=UPI00225C6F2B|nr:MULTISPECIES: hypothetical protein [unclassified Shinella]MCO5140890.1 hypothetical protein [Shinella sp.]MDC7256419.1 hypothetical protein [Shinella sp. YE25]CAI0339285.1 conserved hypothetical protein [Rhizobiaceae bacterium]CAK7257696.1 conserved protein of unknown function [Shinella sp. WSC3-e]